jgi:tetratricopeptide (TPR) repeat protein
MYETLDSDRFPLLNDLYPLSMYRDSQIRKAKALSAVGKVNEAEALVVRHGALLYSDASLSEELVAKMLDRGQTEVAKRIFGLQADWFTSQLQQCPNSNLLLNNFAWTCVCAGLQTELATYCSERSLQVRPKQKHYMDTLAALYFKQGRVEEAVQLTRQCLTQDPENPHYRTQLKKFRAALGPSSDGN